MAFKQTRPISVPEGGTGNTTLGSTGILVGAGTGAVTALIPGTSGQIIVGATSSNPSFITATAGTGLSFSASSSSFQYSLSVPVTVANGGTGNTSFSTPFAPIIAGATSTTALGQATTGMSNSGWVLTSNGSASAPTWQATGAGTGVASLFGDNTTPITTATSVKITGGTSGAVFTSTTTAVTLSFNTLNLPTTTSSVGQIKINGTTILQAAGTQNLFVGPGVGNYTLSGNENLAVGYNSLGSISSGSSNVAIGFNASPSISSGSLNTCVGTGAGFTITTESDLVAVGRFALGNSAGGVRNTAIGYEAIAGPTSPGITGGDNTCVGYTAGTAIAGGGQNTIIGSFAGSNLVSGTTNSVLGTSALFSATNATGCVALGYEALYNNVSGNNNVAIGAGAGAFITGSNNIIINDNGTGGYNNVLKIGAGTGTGGQQINTALISGINGISVTGAAVIVSTGDQLGVTVSSRRYKENIEDMQDFSSDILRLRPVKFNAISDETKKVVGGFIAEEVADIMPNLVVYDKEGLPQTVMYHDLPAMLVNELQKAIIRIEELERKVAYLEDK